MCEIKQVFVFQWVWAKVRIMQQNSFLSYKASIFYNSENLVISLKKKESSNITVQMPGFSNSLRNLLVHQVTSKYDKELMPKVRDKCNSQNILLICIGFDFD